MSDQHHSHDAHCPLDTSWKSLWWAILQSIVSPLLQCACLLVGVQASFHRYAGSLYGISVIFQNAVEALKRFRTQRHYCLWQLYRQINESVALTPMISRPVKLLHHRQNHAGDIGWQWPSLRRQTVHSKSTIDRDHWQLEFSCQRMLASEVALLYGFVDADQLLGKPRSREKPSSGSPTLTECRQVVHISAGSHISCVSQ